MNARYPVYLAVLCLLVCTASRPASGKAPGGRQWEQEIRAFEAADRTEPPPPGAILFVGSSTIRMWTTLAQDFPEYQVINRGFGGCQIADCTYYADRIVIPYKPQLIVLRAGGNDLQAGKTPGQVRDDFQAFVQKVRAKLPKVRIAYMTINATPARWASVEREKKANHLIKDFIAKGENLDYVDTLDATMGADGKPRAELFLKDHLHFNAKGYKLIAARYGTIWRMPPPARRGLILAPGCTPIDDRGGGLQNAGLSPSSQGHLAPHLVCDGRKSKCRTTCPSQHRPPANAWFPLMRCGDSTCSGSSAAKAWRLRSSSSAASRSGRPYSRNSIMRRGKGSDATT